MVCERRHGSGKVIKNIGCSSRPEGKSVLLNQDKDNNKLLLIYPMLSLVLLRVTHGESQGVMKVVESTWVWNFSSYSKLNTFYCYWL